ncbi:PIN-like domain-containing protein [Ensifer canadensis]
MKSTFSEFYKATDDELKALWKESLFVIDANVVLNLYRYPGTVRDDLLKALHKVADRLWMPFQAAFEYQRKRLDVIADQKKAFDTIKNELTGSVSKMQALFSARHPLIEQGSLVEDVKKLVNEYIEKLQPLSDQQPAVHENDKIREEIDKLLNGRVGPEPSKEAVETICANGHDRYERKVPPGFMDIKKEEVQHFRGDSIRSEIW